jgi:hypothetical protein
VSDFPFISNHIRLAIVDDVNYEEGVVRIRWMDNNAEDGQEIPIPHPFSGRGEGIFIGIRPGTMIALSMAALEQYIPVAIIPGRGFYNEELGILSEAHFDDVGYPSIESGEIVLQGVSGNKIIIKSDGSLYVQNQFREGTLLSGESDEEHRCSIITVPPVMYTISPAGVQAFGVVRRDFRPDEGEFDAAVVDPLFDPEYEHIIEEVGRDPSKNVTRGTRKASTGRSGTISDRFRNPPFMEKRGVIYEFGRPWLVDVQENEESLLNQDDLPVRVSNDRREHRTNVLSLSLLYPNELIESVDGTLVDIFGNLLDINRSVILTPGGNAQKDILESSTENARHTVVVHREINSRKGWAYRTIKTSGRPPKAVGAPAVPGLPDASSSANNAKDRSRWSVDIDKEGLTKINIPSSSETGNVPFLSRYESSSSVEVDDKGNPKLNSRTALNAKQLYRSEPDSGQPRRDIFPDQFGPGGITVVQRQVTPGNGETIRTVDTAPNNRLAALKTSFVEGSQRLLPGKLEAGTAFHDITQTAFALLDKTINRVSVDAVDPDASTDVDSDDAATSDTVLRAVPSGSEGDVNRDDSGRPTNYPNAGGRSLNINLDGSLETSIGANTIDRLSWIMDTAGGIVARIGRDRSGRSAVIHMDGSLAMEVGGFDFVGTSTSDQVDTRFSGGGVARANGLPKDQQMFRAGKVVIRVRRPNDDSTGPDTDDEDQVIIIDENGITIESTGRLNLKSSQDTIIQSKARIVLDSETIQFYTGDIKRLLMRNGKTLI